MKGPTVTTSQQLSADLLTQEQEGIIEDFHVRPSATPVPETDRLSLLTKPQFGTVFTDHMARISWESQQGWVDHRIVPYGPLSLDPATAVLHYGQEVFEGLKAYRHEDGTIWAFRPDHNAARLARSAHRLALPALPVDDFMAAIAALVRIDAQWVPSTADSSLYLRPFMFASEPFLGVRPSQEAEFLVIASPAGSYFAQGIKPVSIWVDTQYHRAAPGGTGAAKCGGNYAASLLPQQIAAGQGFDQVCYLDGDMGQLGHEQYLEELGGMNLFIVMANGEVHTPRLTGSILEGITRESIIELASDRGRTVVERRISITELAQGLASGSIAEIFACGTAAVITPVGRMASDTFDHEVGDGQAGVLTMALREELTGIQYGRIPDRHQWLTRIC